MIVVNAKVGIIAALMAFVAGDKETVIVIKTAPMDSNAEPTIAEQWLEDVPHSTQPTIAATDDSKNI